MYKSRLINEPSSARLSRPLPLKSAAAKVAVKKLLRTSWRAMPFLWDLLFFPPLFLKKKRGHWINLKITHLKEGWTEFWLPCILEPSDILMRNNNINSKIPLMFVFQFTYRCDYQLVIISLSKQKAADQSSAKACFVYATGCINYGSRNRCVGFSDDLSSHTSFCPGQWLACAQPRQTANHHPQVEFLPVTKTNKA